MLRVKKKIRYTLAMSFFLPVWMRRVSRRLGPGFITGASDDDPSGITTYTQAGAQFGFGQLWTGSLTIPLMICVQEMAARIGIASGHGMGALLKRHYPRWVMGVFVTGLVLANTVNIGADLGAMADAARLLYPSISYGAYAVGFTMGILALEVFVTYERYARLLKWLTASLLAYLFTMILVTNDWGSVLRYMAMPHLEWNRSFLFMLAALFGTTISPYLLVWQSNQELEEKKKPTPETMRAVRVDTVFGMIFSNLIMLCIIVTAAGVFFRHGLYDIQTSAQAAQALAPLAGSLSSLLFALGIIGTGLLAVPILSASAAYALAEVFEWREGLGKTLQQARAFYGVIIFSTCVGLLGNFFGIPPIHFLLGAAVLNGVITPILLWIMLHIANKAAIMGPWVNGRVSNVVGGFTATVMTVIAISLLFAYV